MENITSKAKTANENTDRFYFTKTSICFLKHHHKIINGMINGENICNKSPTNLISKQYVIKMRTLIDRYPISLIQDAY